MLFVIGGGATAYLLLGGADFGGGILDLMATGQSAERQRATIAGAIAPVWEANHVWVIFVMTSLLAAFPAAFARLGVGLYVPFSVALLGIVFRGAAFAFRSHGDPGSSWQRRWTRVFGVASLITPIALAAGAGAIASGEVGAGALSIWTSAVPLLTAGLALVMCAFLAASYLTVESADAGDRELESIFRSRAILFGVVAGLLALVGLAVVRAHAPVLWAGMRARGLPLVSLSASAGCASIATLLRRRYRVSRLCSALAVAAVVWGWGASQWPYLIVPGLTVRAASAPANVVRLVLGCSIAGAAILVPSLLLLFRIFKSSRAARPAPTTSPVP
jgi:cytochrome bd ubiquinol oxidase subunit II